MLATESSVAHAEASQSVLDLWYYILITTQINIESGIDITD